MSDVVRASHILLMYSGSLRSATDRSKEQALEQIRSIKTELDNGADFAAIARERSDCLSRDAGGDLGAFTRGQMVESFEEAAFALAVGAHSDVVETPFGYHLIRRTA